MKKLDHEHLRVLDIDDLFILSSLLENQKLSSIAKVLRITPPALSHRIKKYRENIPNFDFEVDRNSVKRFSLETEQFCNRAKMALQALEHEEIHD